MMPLHSMKSFLNRVTLDNPYLTPAADDFLVLCGEISAQGGDVSDCERDDSARPTLTVREELLADRGETLQADLALQAEMLHISSRELEVLLRLIAALDGDGYLREGDAALSELLGCELASVEHARAALQSLMPKGVGARDLRECLLLQIDPDDADCGLVREIIESDLELVAQKRYRRIASKRRAAPERIERACGIITAMQPRPGAGFSRERAVRYIYPDARIAKISGGLELSVGGGVQSTICFDPDYMRGVSDESAIVFLRQKRLEAVNLIHSIEMRHTIIRRLLELIMIEQSDFFRLGPGYVRPMMMKSAAQRLKVSPSTVTRCAQDKYVDTPWGIFPFDYFFQQPRGGEQTCPVQIKQSLEALIAGESKSCPLGDEELCERLREQGVDISRRTVSKYRENLGFPGKRERKRLFDEQR